MRRNLFLLSNCDILEVQTISWLPRLVACFVGASFFERSTIHPICELSSSGALPFYMTLARYKAWVLGTHPRGCSCAQRAASAIVTSLSFSLYSPLHPPHTGLTLANTKLNITCLEY
ncbi:hypothetical protein RR48_08776 [Papilio machaon]|uniref:Uncharacterized protein n=1 Tax=Papilio machaon TaxID=76193 RepID=A0A194RIX2_PAPMA|nr:hypothetical protein RR48_08776 [Papilio machaon]